MKRRLLLALALAGPALGVMARPALADSAHENPDDVVAAAKQAALALAPPGAQVTISQAKAAAYMPACTAPLSVAITGTAPYQEAAVHCPAPVWVLYLTANVAAQQLVEVAARPIQAGQTLSEDDVSLAEKPVSLFAGRQTFAGAQQLIGAQARLSLQPGAVITSDAVAQPVVVSTGQTVAVQVKDGGVVVSVNAVADQTGRIGDTILMTNPGSGRRFSALLTASGPVVDLGS